MLRVGVVGAGRWGTRVMRVLDSLEVQVIAVDTDPEVDARAGSIVGDLAEMGQVDAVVIATPATTHADVIDLVWHLDVPVFCEKPFTTDVADAHRLAARDDGRIFVMHIWRYHPGIEALGDMARAGELGEVLGVRSTRVNWTSPRTDTDAIWTLLPHDVTLAIEILGYIPTPRSAIVERPNGRAVGIWAQCGGAGEPWLVADASTRYADKRREVRVHGSDGVAVLAGLDTDTIEIARGHALEPRIEQRPFAVAEPLVRELEAFCQFVRGGDAPKSDVDEGVAVVEAVALLRGMGGLEP